MAFTIDNSAFFNVDNNFEPKELKIQDSTDMGGSVLGGAMSGGSALMSTGNPFLIAGGAVAGGVMGAMGANKQKAAIAKQNAAITNRNLVKENKQGAIIKNTLPKFVAKPFG